MQKILYQDPSTNTNIENIVFFNDTIWMTQTQIGNLYGKANSTVSEHIKKIYKDGELKKALTSKDDRIFGNTENTTKKSFKKPKKYYNLQVIIAVGFKVNSPQAISFRTRANKIIESYMSTGYAYERDLTMEDWKEYLDNLLKMNKLDILDGKGKVSREKAEKYVKKQMAEYQEKWGTLEAYIEGAEYHLSK